jgi:hypothetical protein
MKLLPIETHTRDKTITKFLMQKLYNRRITSKRLWDINGDVKQCVRLKKHKGIIKVYLFLNSSLRDPVVVGKFYHAQQHEKNDVFL